MGIISLNDLSTARTRVLDAEERRERIFANPAAMRPWASKRLR
jgi:hypothetical protein